MILHAVFRDGKCGHWLAVSLTPAELVELYSRYPRTYDLSEDIRAEILRRLKRLDDIEAAKGQARKEVNPTDRCIQRGED